MFCGVEVEALLQPGTYLLLGFVLGNSATALLGALDLGLESAQEVERNSDGMLEKLVEQFGSAVLVLEVEDRNVQ